jgi:hypothetical protein
MYTESMNHWRNMPRRKHQEIGGRVTEDPLQNHPSRRYASFLGEIAILFEGREVCRHRVWAAGEFLLITNQ